MIKKKEETAAERRAANNRIRGMKLLPQEIRKKVPPLYAQDGKGGQTIAYAKWFTPDGEWTWYICESEPVQDDNCNGTDYTLFGLVEGHEKELGYFRLSEIERVRGPMGLPIERDLWWTPKTLAEIAPEMYPQGKE